MRHKEPKAATLIAAYLMQRVPAARSAYTVACDAERLCAISRAVNRLDCEACNRDLRKNEETRRDRLCEEASIIADAYSLVAHHQADPRGCSIQLYAPDADPIRDEPLVRVAS